ncbi:hypothetical protein ADIAG_03372 [Paeniglutamicibacter gangotriensis Lz1y]|uniref:Uncharacterized protein n=1 Tax=Paeniglutamicibacter gangotriensis Lz1y TaxID=1276920 RepID=M7MLK0_9MICC|nr:hypothetical protein ADIAG_03372 [Paeniglutamicibacter gangotriensis Lz1y]
MAEAYPDVVWILNRQPASTYQSALPRRNEAP